MIALLIFLIVLAFVAWLVLQIPMEPTVAQIVRGLIIIIAVLAVLEAVGIVHTGLLSGVHL